MCSSYLNYTPQESEIKERAQLYCKSDHDYATDVFVVYPDIYRRGPRFFTYPASETQYDNILYATGWSFPDFLQMELDGGGQWNYRSFGAVVGATGPKITSYFANASSNTFLMEAFTRRAFR